MGASLARPRDDDSLRAAGSAGSFHFAGSVLSGECRAFLPRLHVCLPPGPEPLPESFLPGLLDQPVDGLRPGASHMVPGCKLGFHATIGDWTRVAVVVAPGADRPGLLLRRYREAEQRLAPGRTSPGLAGGSGGVTSLRAVARQRSDGLGLCVRRVAV